MCKACEWEKWADRCEQLLEDAADVPERSADFASGVIEKVSSMAEWIDENEHVTDKMTVALENMEKAIKRALERR